MALKGRLKKSIDSGTPCHKNYIEHMWIKCDCEFGRIQIEYALFFADVHINALGTHIGVFHVISARLCIFNGEVAFCHTELSFLSPPQICIFIRMCTYRSFHTQVQLKMRIFCNRDFAFLWILHELDFFLAGV